jgi:hypothetical protein
MLSLLSLFSLSALCSLLTLCSLSHRPQPPRQPPLARSLLSFSLSARFLPRPTRAQPAEPAQATPSHRSQLSLPVAPITAESPPLPAPICPR